MSLYYDPVSCMFHKQSMDILLTVQSYISGSEVNANEQ